ncbi:MAG TPA: DUF1801 domain-containing protein [Ktedonobacterales bacterium]
MDNQRPQGSTIDEYIAGCPAEIQATLQELRAIIRAAAPDAEEIISYGMPAFAQHGNLVYFAVNKHHIGFYPTSSGIAAFEQELSRYKGTKGSAHFPFDQPLPVDLITRIVRYRVAQNLERVAARTYAKKDSRSGA